ncbi:MAG: hypothetical protein K6F91_00085 [Ruminococcus sp.]|nr:hypothetical protein [Ruminococcus sp.]
MDNNFDPFGNRPPEDNGFLGSPGQGYNAPYGSGGQWNRQGGYNNQPNGLYPGSGNYNNQQNGFYPGSGNYNNQQNGFYPGNGNYNNQQGGYYPGGYNQQGGYYGGQPQNGFTPNAGGYNSPYGANPYAQSGYYNRSTGFNGRAMTRNLPAIPGAPINYMIFLPLFGLFMENFAPSIVLGFLLWGLVMIFLRVAAYRDAKAAVEKDILRDSVKTVAVLAPIVYLFMRSQAMSRGFGKFIALCLTAAIAIFTNGFTQSVRMTPQSFIETAKSRYLSELDVFEKVENVNENYMLADRVDSFMTETDWSYSEFGGKKCVVLKGKFKNSAPDDYKGKELMVKLKSNFDGYNIKSLHFVFDECEIDGEAVKGDDKDKLVKGLTHDWSAPTDKTDDSSADNSSK